MPSNLHKARMASMACDHVCVTEHGSSPTSRIPQAISFSARPLPLAHTTTRRMVSLDTMGESGPVVALHARARTLSRTRTRTRTRTYSDSHSTACTSDHCTCESARFHARALASAGPYEPSPRTHTSTCTRTRAHTGTHMSTVTHA